MRDQRLLALAKHMRSNPTPAEAHMWYNLRAHRFERWKFKHQTVLAPYIVDFSCRSAMLIVEVDGDTHSMTEMYERAEQLFFSGKVGGCCASPTPT